MHKPRGLVVPMSLVIMFGAIWSYLIKDTAHPIRYFAAIWLLCLGFLILEYRVWLLRWGKYLFEHIPFSEENALTAIEIAKRCELKKPPYTILRHLEQIGRVRSREMERAIDSQYPKRVYWAPPADAS